MNMTDTNTTQITTTFGKLYNATPALTRLVDVKQPQKLVYQVAKLVKLAQAELKHFEEQRDALIKKYGVERDPTPEELAKRGSGAITEITDLADMKKYTKEIEDLTEVEIVLPWKKIKFADLKDFPMSAADVLALEDILDIDDEAMGGTAEVKADTKVDSKPDTK